MIRRFGEFELDPLTKTLRREGGVVPVEPKVFALLSFLTAHPHYPLGRAALQRAVWGEVVVSSNSLTRLVKEARRAIGDCSSKPRWIQTRWGLGYEFVGDVVQVRVGTIDHTADALVAGAEKALFAAMERGSLDLRRDVEEFVRTCRLALTASSATGCDGVAGSLHTPQSSPNHHLRGGASRYASRRVGAGSGGHATRIDREAKCDGLDDEF